MKKRTWLKRILRRYKTSLKLISNSSTIWLTLHVIFSLATFQAFCGHAGIKFSWLRPVIYKSLTDTFNWLSPPDNLPRLLVALISGSLAYHASLYSAHLLFLFSGISSSPRLIGFQLQPLNFTLTSIFSPLAIAASGLIASETFHQVYPTIAPPLHHHWKYFRFVLCLTLLSFRLLRASSAGIMAPTFRCIAPSELIHEGSFACYEASLPATKERYVNEGERIMINKFSQSHGCHHCGLISNSTKYHGDHIPVTKHVKHGLRAFIAGKQKFFPQCEHCSNRQGSAVRLGLRKLVRHRVFSLRAWHIWIPAPLVYNMIITQVAPKNPLQFLF